MSTDYIVSLPAVDAVWDDLNPQPAMSVLMTEYNDGADKEAYLVTAYNAPDWPVSTYIVGAWDTDTGLQDGQSYDVDGTTVIGTPNYALHADYLTYIRPLGNDNGRATGMLDSMRWQGHPEEKFVENDERYPDTNNPFTITIVRDDNSVGQLWDAGTTYNENDKVVWNNKGWNSMVANNLGNEPGTSPPRWEEIDNGWGWTATMIKASTSRPSIVNYKMGIYPTEDCTPGTEIYFTGAFQDVGGGIYQSSAPSGQWTIDPDVVNFALIYSPGPDAQEGIIILFEGQDEVTGQFWSTDQ